MKKIQLGLEFSHQYEVEIVDEWSGCPNQVRRIYFPRAAEGGGSSGGLLVEVTPRIGDVWLGVFASGYRSPASLSKVFSCPNEKCVCVISSGTGYIVRVDKPGTWEEIKLHPIIDARSILDRSLIVFASFTELVANGTAGMVWRTARLSWDGLKIIDVTSEVIRGLAWDSPLNKEVEFTVNLRTGQHEGGSSPDKYSISR